MAFFFVIVKRKCHKVDDSSFFATSLNRKGVIKMTSRAKTKTIVIATAITLLSATVAFADTSSSNTVPAPKFSQAQSGEASGWFKSYLDSLVKDGAITQAQETTIKIAITIAKEESTDNSDIKSGDNGRFKTVLDGLVKKGIITQVQEAAIKSAITIANEDAVANGDFKSVDNGGSKYVLDGLVKDGTITHIQEIAIQSANLNSKG